MKTYKVYEIINSLGTVEYVGESTDPEFRFKRHTRYKYNPASNTGKFYHRDDVYMRVVGEYLTKKEAWNVQCELQKKYGIPTDASKVGIIPGWNKKLTMKQAYEIKQLYSTGQYTMKRIAEMYNVSTHPIRMIIRNITYINETLS